jgi:cytochrome P450
VDNSTAAPRHDQFDPLDASFIANPVPHYARLRADSPVVYGPRWDFWTLTRYDDIVAAATRPKVFSSEWGITVPPNRVSGRRAPMHFDPPEHTAVRRAMNEPFRDERLLALEPHVRASARELLRTLAGRTGVDVAAGYSSPLTSLALAAFLGLSAEDGSFLDVHSLRFEDAQFAFDADTAQAENLVLYEYAGDIVAARRREPRDPRDDLVTALLDFVDRNADLDDGFVAGSLRQLFIAAHVAPRVAIAAAIVHLAEDRALQDGLRSDPRLLPAAVEEMLRLHTPNQGFSRTAREDVEVRGCPIHAGQQVAFAYPSANRDPAVFPHPDTFDLDRENKRHLAFGSGVHKCVGATLARLEMRVALEELLSATAAFHLAAEPVMIAWPLTGPAQALLTSTGREHSEG